ncbi:hypothetical protein R1sor_023836 [Riccia sorocarpa]|uniref:Reverse transcriptase n=1 Tax=Riccia sorocarpa TaxID=122646 RepID=A0ABD3GNT1_9MARC
MYQIQNMKQQEKETIKEFLTRFRLMIRRLEVPPTDAQKITWLRNEVHQRFITSVEDRGYANADDFEDKLKTCAYSMAYRDEAFSNERDAYRRTAQDSEDEHSDDSSGTKKKKRYLREQRTEQKLVNHWKKVLSSIGKDRAQQSTPTPMRYCHICNNNSHDTRVCYYNAKNSQTRKGRDVPVHAIEGVKETPVREEPRRNYPRRNCGEGSSQQQTGLLECYYCYEKGHIKRNCNLFKKHMDERRTSKTPHVAGSNAIYVELKDNTSVSVMTREIRRQAPELDVIPDSIPDDDLTPLRRWDKEDQVTKDTIDFIQEMQTSDEQEDVEVGNEGDYFPFSNMEPPEDDPNSDYRMTICRRETPYRTIRIYRMEPDVGVASIAPWMDIGPVLQIQVKGMRLPNILIDGGSGANVISAELYEKLKDTALHPTPFNLKMADQRRVVPLGMVKNLPIRIKDMSFDIDAVVLPKGQTKGQVLMILRRPWLRHNNVRQEWDLTKNFVELVWRGERRRISTVPRCIPNKASIQPIEVCTLIWEDGLSEEEEMMLQWAMLSLWTIAEIDIEPMEPTSSPDLQQGETSRRHVQFNESTIVLEKAEGEELKYPKTLSWKRTVVEIEDATRATRWLQTLPAKDVLKEKIHNYTIAPEGTYEEVNIGTMEMPKLVKIGNHLSEEQKKGIIKLLKDYSQVFAWTYEDMKGVPPEICQHKIKLLPSAKPLVQRPYRMNPNYAETVKKEIEKLKEADFIYPVKEYDWLSPIVIVPKKNGKLRVCVDYRKLNEFTVKDLYPIPFIDDILDKVAGREAYTFMDGYSGYNKVEISPEDRKKTTFITPWGAYAYARMPFGLSNTPATFQRLVIDTFAEYLGDFMEAFLDDFTVYGSADQHLQQLEKALIKCLENQISLNPEKCVFWVQSGVLLGHIICSEGILMDQGKVEKIRKQPAPTNRKELQRVMGMANFYRRYILNYVVLAASVNALNKENVVFKWTPQCQEAFDLLKEKLSQGPILRPPKWNMIFHVHTDASGVAVGAVLAQPQDPKIDLPIYFASRTLNNSEKDYITTEREALAMVYAVKKFKPYLQEMGRETEHEDDSFPDEYLLNINLEKPDTYVSSGDETDDSRGGETYEGLLKGGWQTPMRYLLTKGSLPEDTPYHIKKKMAQKSAQYTLIEGELYKQGIDQEVNPPRTTDYTTKWVEAECYRTNDKKVTAKFIYENIITRLGVPVELVFDQGGHFLNGVIEELTTHYQVKHRFSTPYYPQCNGQAESTNKILIVALRKLVERHPVNWDASVPSVLWAMRTAYKATTNHTLFHMVYGVEALVPMEFIVPTLRIATEYNLNPEEMLERRLKELLQLEESREQAFAHQCAVQERRKRGDPFVEQVEDILRDMESTTKEYYPEVADDYRIELTPKEGEEIPFNQGEKISNRARRWREAKQAKQKFLLEKNKYRIGVPPTNNYLNRYPGEKNPLEWKQPKEGKRRMNDVRRMYKKETYKVFYAWKDYALSLERMRYPFTYNPEKGKKKVSNQDSCYDNGLQRSKETRVSNRRSLWEKYYYGTGEPSTSTYPDVDLYNIYVIDMSEEHASDDDTKKGIMQHVPIKLMNRNGKDVNCYIISILPEEAQPDDVNVMTWEQLPDAHPDGCYSSGMDNEGTEKGISTTHDGRVRRQWMGSEEHRRIINYMKTPGLWQVPNKGVINPTVNCFAVSYETNRRTTRGRKRSESAVEAMQYPIEDQAELVWIDNFEEVLVVATRGVVQAHPTGPFRKRVEKKVTLSIESERELSRETRGEGVDEQSEKITVSKEADSTSKGRDSEAEEGSTSKGRDRIGESAVIQPENQFVVLVEQAAEPEVVTTSEEVVENPVQESQPDKGKELAADEVRPDENPVEAGVYRKEFTRKIADLCTGGPSLVQLPARFEPMGNPLHPWEYVAAHAKATLLHLNEVIRNDIDQNLVPTREDLFALVKDRVEQRKRDQDELFNSVFTRNLVPRPGQLNPVSMPPSSFEQLGFLLSLQSRGYLDWLDTNERTQSAESMRLLDPELRERWTDATAFTQNLVSNCTGVFGLMQELYSAYDLLALSITRKQMREHLDELARCQHRFNCQFTRNIETGALLEIMYGLLDKADPTGKYFTEYEEKVYEMRRQLDRDQEFWFRSRGTDMGHAELRRQFFADSGGPSDPRPTGDQVGSQEERGVSGPSSSNAGSTPPDSPRKAK